MPLENQQVIIPRSMAALPLALGMGEGVSSRVVVHGPQAVTPAHWFPSTTSVLTKSLSRMQ